MAYCPKCGYKLDQDHNFCPSCGYDVRNIADQVQEEAEAEVYEGQVEDFAVCDVCGEETPAGLDVCESCGAKLTGKEKIVQKSQNRPPAAEKPKEIKTEEKKNTKINKPKPAVQKSQAQKAARKTPRPVQHAPAQASGKAINTSMLGMILAGLFVVGAMILYFAGVFDSPEKGQASDNMPQEQGQINLGAVQELDALEKEVLRDTSNYSLMLDLAHKLNDMGFKEKAINYYDRYLRKYPSNTDVLVDRGVCYFDLKQYDKAKQSMIKAWRINPRHQIANFNLGIVHSQSGSPDSAKIWWGRAAEINPDSELGKKSKELLVSQ